MHPLQKVVGNKDSIRVPLGALEVLNWAPAQLTASERLMLFTLIYSLRPQRYLEIGTFEGGSALIVGAAMDAANLESSITCVDIKPKVAPENWKRIEHRAKMVTGDAAVVLPEARRVAGGLFDFAFIDGDHQEGSVVRDALRVLRELAPRGYVLFHDGHNPGVARAIGRVLGLDRSSWVDYGTITREFTEVNRNGEEMRYCGFWLVQRQPGTFWGHVGRRCKTAVGYGRSVAKRVVRRLGGSSPGSRKQREPAPADNRLESGTDGA